MSKKIIPSVLAFDKKLVVSDGFMFGVLWENRKGVAIPLSVVEKSIKGTISHRLHKPLQEDPVKLDADKENANLQTVDNCALGRNQDTLKLQFSLRVLSGVEVPSSCNSLEFKEVYAVAANDYLKREGCMELAPRYATNIANGRFLWRNRVGARNIEIEVNNKTSKDVIEVWNFNAKDISTRHFNNNGHITELAERIADALSGKTEFLLLEINAYVQVGEAQEVYPSEELILDKGRGKKGKVLYSVNEIAAMHSQKLGNALRTIDTWYPGYAELNIGPISVEPYGSATNLGRAFRDPKSKVDFFTLFDKWAFGEKIEKEEEHYVMATLIRGGIFGKSSKE